MRFKPSYLLPVLCAMLVSSTVVAQTIFPLTRADILAGSHFDFKVEFGAVVDPDQIKVTINGRDYSKVLGKKAQLLAREDASAVASTPEELGKFLRAESARWAGIIKAVGVKGE